jgi:aminoglycoside phosphotransferase (APT) family kinase protein
MVYRDGKPYALIDFDEAGPGPRVWDVAYAAYRFVPLVHAHDLVIAQADLTDPGKQARRLQLFCDTYRIATSEVLATVEPRLQAMCTALIERAEKGHAAFQKMIEEGHLDHYRQELLDWQIYRLQIEQNLM